MTLPELTAKLAALDKSRAALESSYERIEFWLFLFTALVVIGLVIEYRDGLKKLFTEWPIDKAHAATMIGAILVVAGVAGELVTEFKASKIESSLQAVSTKTEGLLFSEAADAEGKIADDNRIATTAASDAASLGVTVNNLHDFVIANKRDLSDQFAAIRKYADDEKKQNDAVIGELARDTADLRKMRADAMSAAADAKTALAVAAAANRPRRFSLAQEKDFVAHLGKYHGVAVRVFLIHAPSPDAAPLAKTIADLLFAAKWNTSAVSNVMGGATFEGVAIMIRSEPNANDKAAADALLNELHADGIEASPFAGVTDEPVKAFGGYTGPPEFHSDIWVVVGSKPVNSPADAN